MRIDAINEQTMKQYSRVTPKSLPHARLPTSASSLVMLEEKEKKKQEQIEERERKKREREEKKKQRQEEMKRKAEEKAKKEVLEKAKKAEERKIQAKQNKNTGSMSASAIDTGRKRIRDGCMKTVVKNV